MAKILFISNITKKIDSFSIASVRAAQSLGLEFHHAAKWEASKEEIVMYEKEFNVKIHNVNLERSPFSLKNIGALKEIIQIIKNERIDYIHCNTPVGGVLGRIAGKFSKVKKVIYQVHGFHFYKGSPKLNWLLYYPIEKWLAHYTDALITINKEDYELAKNKMKLRNNGNVYYVPGVGIDLSQYIMEYETREIKRRELCIADDEFVIISMGDLIKRKNYDVSIQAVSKVNNPKIRYLICGKGPRKSHLEKLAKKLNIEKQVMFLGYRTDIKELLNASDLFLFTTKQEGLSRSLMEAMASGLPCVVSDIRGNNDMIENKTGGFLCNPNDVNDFSKRIEMLLDGINLRNTMKKNNLNKINQFSFDIIEKELLKIYFELFHQ